MNYKEPLNLPRTTFSMKANLAQNEPKLLDSKWKEIYSLLRVRNKDAEKYILHDGPPYANGLIHIGHVLNKILKDIILKYKTLQGFDVPFTVGWDCHGLPVEHQLFKELKLTKHDVDIADFRKKAKKFAMKFVELQKKDFKRMGIFSDWENPYLTLNREYEYEVITLLEYLTGEGYIYRGLKPVNWCAKCETALAEAEVEYENKESDSIYFLFKVADDNQMFSSIKEDVHFLVWTTTPWTLIANVAVAVHPDLDYALTRAQDRYLVCARELIPSIESKLNRTLTVISEFKGKDFENITLTHPFIERKPRVVLAEYVSREEGSGCVHIAPGHGEEDFSLVKKYALKVLMPVNEKGRFENDVPGFEGKDISAASEEIVGILRSNGALLLHEKIVHSYPHCWRCKKPIIFRATYQWFLNIDHKNLREKILKEIENITWIPQSGMERMRSMISNRPDWCLSRQRLWGIPIPAIKCSACSAIFLKKEIVKTTADIFRKKGSDSWFTDDVASFLPEEFSCPECGAKKFTREYDILDVWFESGASFAGVVQNSPQLRFPSDMCLEGSDQHRGWFQVSLILSMAREKKSPFNAVLTHGFVVDGEGKKMSKSRGNVISPQKVVNQYGAEILRLWVAYSDYSDDIKLSPQILKQVIDIYRKIRNTIRFILGNIHDFCPQNDTVSLDNLIEIDRYMLSKAVHTFEEISACYGNSSFYKVCQHIFNFCNIDMSSFYLDILKDRLYTCSRNSKERRSAQTVLYLILKTLIKMCAPIISFTSEDAWSAFENMEDKEESVFFHTFEDLSKYKDTELLRRWEKIMELREKVLKEIEKKRKLNEIGSALDAEVEVWTEDEYTFLKNYEDALREVFIVSEVEVKQGRFNIEVSKSEKSKCLRCWMRRADVGSDTNYPDICGKCVEAVKGG